MTEFVTLLWCFRDSTTIIYNATLPDITLLHQTPVMMVCNGLQSFWAYGFMVS